MSEHFLRARRLAGRVIGGRTVGPARAVGMVAGLGMCSGFIGVVFAIACESFFSVPDGVAAKDYLTIGCREAESDLFVTVSTIDYFEIKSAAPEIELSYGEYYLGEGRRPMARVGCTASTSGGCRAASSRFLAWIRP